MPGSQEAELALLPYASDLISDAFGPGREALAAAIIFDAFIVRMVLIPALL